MALLFIFLPGHVEISKKLKFGSRRCFGRALPESNDFQAILVTQRIAVLSD